MDHQSPSRKAPGLCSLRYSLALLLHFCNVAMISQRSCLTLTIVSMVNSSAPQGVPNASTSEHLDSIKNPVYNWSPQTQGIILSAIIYGMPFAQIPMGYISGLYPIKTVTSLGLLLSSLCNMLVPLAAEQGESLIIACRVVQGLSQGTVMVAQYTVWSKWAPPLERNRLTSVSVSGNMLGPCISLFATGFISQSLGWPVVFYIFGAGGCALSLLWFLLFYDDPAEHPWISLSEKEFITSSIVQNGVLSGLPYLLGWVFGNLAGCLADFFLARKILSLITIRKLFTTLGLLLPSLFSVSLLHPGASHLSTVACLMLASATPSFCTAGMLINPLDIAPRYYGLVKGITILFGIIGGLISSTLTGIILNQDPESSWLKIFLLMAALNVTSLIFYLVFMKVDVQDWAKELQQIRL
ncbi:sodium-dependent phosphate transport protein 1 isoform X4 [Artibeus jamaicensis]|uniref:sodium-dependent phosphate transport protein 1 isoform X4 n=1 Tax=Artibeus jamaicensis TaxID=9417 RepID=UPI00235B05C4|nr:sodium-dependent phosphate transport protein 1 isoform X4 [Artibeus jamaicensis]